MHRILYVDDDEILVQLVRRVLRRSGFEIVHAEAPDAVLALVAAERFDAIVLDHYLRSGTGHNVLARLREAGVALPVVYVTASSDASIAVRALKSGAADYVIKSPGEEFMALLERAIRQSIDTARLRAEKERAEEEIRRGKERAEALLTEVNHRVANSLALVASLLRLQAGATEDAAVKHILNETCGRIAAIVNVHRSLYAGAELHEVRMDRYLGAMVADLALTLPGHVRLALDAAPVAVRPDQAVSVGIIVTELTVNAAKYAYPDERPGEVRITFTADERGLACISVADDGVGYDPEASPVGSGLGKRIVRSMAAGLGSDLELRVDGSGSEARVCFAIEPPPVPATRNASVA